MQLTYINDTKTCEINEKENVTYITFPKLLFKDVTSCSTKTASTT